MFDRNFLPCLFLGVAALAWPLSLAAIQPGVLSAKASVVPERIMPEGKTQITVVTLDGFQRPIPVASVKISIDTGYFEASNQNAVFGFTDKEGVFQAVWHANLQTKAGAQRFEVTVGKNGYIGKYPLTATAKVLVEDPSKPSATGSPHDDSDKMPADPLRQDR